MKVREIVEAINTFLGRTSLENDSLEDQIKDCLLKMIRKYLNYLNEEKCYKTFVMHKYMKLAIKDPSLIIVDLVPSELAIINASTVISIASLNKTNSKSFDLKFLNEYSMGEFIRGFTGLLRTNIPEIGYKCSGSGTEELKNLIKDFFEIDNQLVAEYDDFILNLKGAEVEVLENHNRIIKLEDVLNGCYSKDVYVKTSKIMRHLIKGYNLMKYREVFKNPKDKYILITSRDKDGSWEETIEYRLITQETFDKLMLNSAVEILKR